MSDVEQKSSTRSRLAVYVRLTEDEYQTLSKDEEITGRSAAELLRKRYFENKIPKVLMPMEERKAWFTELRRWGNNLNQLARRVNSGVMEGWYQEFSEIARRLSAIENKVVAIYGDH